MVERIEITNENIKDDDELELLLGEIPHATSSLTHHHHHQQHHLPSHVNDNGYEPVLSQTINGMMYGMYDDDPSCSYKQNPCIVPATATSLQSNGSFSSFFSKDDPTPKPHLMFRTYSSILPYFGKKFDDNLFSESGNQGEDLVRDPNVGTNRINFSKPFSDCAVNQSHSSRNPMFATEFSPFFGYQHIPPPRAENLFAQSHFNRNVLNLRYPVAYQRAIPSLDLPLSNGLYTASQNEDSLIIHGETVNHVRNSNKVIGGFRGQHKKCSLHEKRSSHVESNHSQFPMANRSFPTPLRCKTLADARGYIYMFSKDQNGCRYIQSVFDEGDQEHVQMVFDEIVGHVAELMVNPFGNYLMQKLLEVCNEEQRMFILMEVTREPRELVQISLNTHGTRVVQKLIETLKTRKQIKVVISALEPGFLALIKDLNGNHVIQRCLQCLSNEDNKFIFEAAAKFCVDIATHQHGCCVLQRCINHSIGKHQESLVLEISSNGLLLAQDAFGNYVVQSILELKIPSAVSMLTSQFEGNYVHLATQKFSSHVVEKCLSVLDDRARSSIIRELLSATHFEQLLQDPHANYVVQTALRVAEGSLHNLLVKAIESHKAISRNSPYSKRIFSHKLLKK
ncbi:unnamed protein product [Lactuca saligna]|uniref:PUM-HD domain-containing protein n=1 Tax=Lactuca saligna TaxID=75948 RepID=A0AA36ESB2_LACSI|nr:unnamed protein product [Lactuca saligna]